MNNQIKLSNYIHFAVQLTCLFLIAKYLKLTLHELGHCLGGWLVGLHPIGVQIKLLGGGHTFFTESYSFLQDLITAALGPGIDLIFGLIVFFLTLPRVKSWGLQLFLLYYAVIALFSFWTYMVIGGFMGIGDFASISHFLSMAKYVFGIMGVIGIIGFAVLVGRRIFKIFKPFFPLDSFYKRFIIIFLFIGIPGIINTLGGYLIAPYKKLNELFLVIAITLIIAGLFSLFRQEKAASIRKLPRMPSLVGAAPLIIIIAIWIGVFGTSAAQPKGIVWRTPQENGVSVCNVLVSLKKDNSAQIDFLMRPFSAQLFWEKLKHQTPNWQVYTQFIEEKFPILLGISDYTIIEKVNDTTSTFFYKTTDTGVRRVTLVTHLDEVIQKINENNYALEITDFWRIKGGFLEKLSITLEDDGMKFLDYQLTPEDAKEPDLYIEQEIVWENKGATAPEKTRLIFTCSNNGKML